MKIKILAVMSLIWIFFWPSIILAYSIEQRNAYLYSYSRWITSQSSIEKANMNGSLTRIAMAKMVSNYAIKVLWLKPDTSLKCSFSDVSLEMDAKYSLWVTQACQLWLMWIWDDWVISKTFNPNWVVTRWQRATVFSRALSQSKWDVVKEWEPYYKNHMEYLNKQWIINDVNNPSHSAEEKRWNVMLMMYRADDSKYDIKEIIWEVDKSSWETNWVKKDEQKDGMTITYYDNGQVKSKWKFIDWKQDWERVWYYENWEIRDVDLWDNWKIVKTTVYYEDWWISEIFNYKNWLPDWERVRYYENGNVKEKIDYKNWLENWNHVIYYENGQIQEKWSFVYVYNGNNNWVWIFSWEELRYYENWQVWRRGTFDNNWFLNWEWITYSEKWEVLFVCSYNHWIFLEWPREDCADVGYPLSIHEKAMAFMEQYNL